MGVTVTTLTKRAWLLLFTSSGIISLLGVFIWNTPSSLIASTQLHLPFLILILLFNSVVIFLLMRLRLLLSHRFWLNVWTGAAPLCISSIVLILVLPTISTVFIAWSLTILFALWGYYRCFYPLFIFDTSLHKARFARRFELADLYADGVDQTSLLLGINHWYALLQHFVLVRPTKTRRELGNLLIVAPTRGGKGLLAVSQLLTWKHSVIVNDIKGELFQQTAGYRSRIGKVFVIDPTGVGHCYDPLQGKMREEELLSAATHMLFDANERERIFTERATVMLTQLFAAAKQEKIPALPYVRSITRTGLEGTAKRLNSLSPEMATQFLDVSFAEAHFSDRFLHSAWSTLTTKLRPLLTETVVRCFTHSDFTPDQIMRSDTPVTIYLRWKEQDLLSLSPLVRLLWASLIDELITTFDRNQGKGCRPVLMLIDEAGRTVIPSLADQATTVVGRGISLWIAIQSLSQLEAVYGKPRAQVLKDNMESQIYYRPQDLSTAQYLELRCGSKSAYAKSTTLRDGRGGEVRSEGRAERPIPLITAQEIMKLRDEEIIGFHRRLPPFKIRRVEWWKHTTLKQRRNIPAPQLALLPAIENIPVFNKTVTKDDDIDPSGII